MGFALLSLSGDPTTIRSVSQAVQSNLAIRAANVLRIVFIVWQGFIWIFALKHARDLEIKEAAVSTFPAIVLAIGLAMAVL